jgi:hypothetical protein
MIRISVNSESLNRAGQIIAQKVSLARLNNAGKIESMMRIAAEDARESSMVATGQTQDNTKYFGRKDGTDEIYLSMGILRGDNEQELFTERLSAHTGGRRVHTTIEEHVKAKCSRSILGEHAGNPSYYRSNPGAKPRAFYRAISQIFGLDFVMHGIRRGGINRYEAASGIKNSNLWRTIISGVKEVFQN